MRGQRHGHPGKKAEGQLGRVSFFFFKLLFIYFIYGRIVDLKYCVNFGCTVMCFSCIYSFSDSFPLGYYKIFNTEPYAIQ